MNKSEPPDTQRLERETGDSAPGRVTPMMEQYIEIRAANPDCLLFYRMGDFYELFFDDAATASRALGITLTKRGRHLGEEIPMCGVPVHAADDYLQKLITLGFRVAVCEQTEDPKEAKRRGAKSVVRRAVTRLVTPGTITEERLLDSNRNNYLASLVRVAASAGGDGHALAWVDISTGEFRISECGPGGLSALLARVEPREVLLPERLAEDSEIRNAISAIEAAPTPLPAAFFEAGAAEARLAELFGVKTMESFGNFSRAELSAGAALIAYIDKTQISKRPPIEPPRRLSDRDSMRIDAATRANLELFRSISGGRAGSLIATVDRTETAAGSRLLAERLANPLTGPTTIAERLDLVEFFVERPGLRADIRTALAGVPDMLRALSRLGLERGGPRDLDAIRAGAEASRTIYHKLQKADPGGNGEVGNPALRLGSRLAEAPPHLAEMLAAALADELPHLKRDGGFVRPGYAAALDEARGLRDESRRVIAGLQARYAEASGIRALKIKHNNVLGYFVEVTAGQAPALQANGGGERFIHRQTMANAMRFTTAELAELEQKIASAADRALAIELELFDDLAAKVAAEEKTIRGAAQALAELDVAAALAELAAAESYVRPKVDRSLAFMIESGRHAVVERALKAEGQSFVGNDCDLGAPSPLWGGGSREAAGGGVAASASERDDKTPHPAAPSLRSGPATLSPQGGEDDGAEFASPPGRIWLLTGPNMAGKSTFLRQNALIAILAQAGSFVPARAAHIGVVDALFSRVGAADDLARGRSTFMVEMVETAAILNQAGPRALVILDEIGRGTATFDGLSIAWAVIEHLHEENRSRALFATHYHELTALASKLPRLMNATVKVKEWKGDVVFLHEVAPGAADRSYGIQVAKLAGLPAAVIARAKTVLDLLEKGERGRPVPIVDDLPLFSVARGMEEEAKEHPVAKALQALDPDALSPKEALERLYELKRLGKS
jgi:DNA mismatch repair protein MutS